MSRHKGERARFTLRLPVEDMEQLQAIADRTGMKVNELICRMIAHTLQQIAPID
ncbi:MAG TPA: ribbon-helix-helix protein, CopG family [Nitrospiraceae bacterium]